MSSEFEPPDSIETVSTMNFTWGDASCSGIMALAGCGSGGISSSSGIAQTGTVIGRWYRRGGVGHHVSTQSGRQRRGC
jgi:hypothetical protein